MHAALDHVIWADNARIRAVSSIIDTLMGDLVCSRLGQSTEGWHSRADESKYDAFFDVRLLLDLLRREYPDNSKLSWLQLRNKLIVVLAIETLARPAELASLLMHAQSIKPSADNKQVSIRFLMNTTAKATMQTWSRYALCSTVPKDSTSLPALLHHWLVHRHDPGRRERSGRAAGGRARALFTTVKGTPERLKTSSISSIITRHIAEAGVNRRNTTFTAHTVGGAVASTARALGWPDDRIRRREDVHEKITCLRDPRCSSRSMSSLSSCA